MKRTLVIPDAHHPFVDKLAWATALAGGRAAKPDIIVVIGDFVDYFQVSAHPKPPERKGRIADEIDAANVALDQLAEIPTERFIYVAGNHEYRMDRYIRDRAPELFGLKGTTVPEQLQLKARDIEYVPYMDYIKIGKMLYTHDLERAGKNAAAQVATDAGTNVVFGHTHRGAVQFQGTVFDGSHVSMNVGWLGDVNSVDYKHRIKALRDWQHGFGIVDQDERGYGWCQFIPIVDGTCVIDGKLITAR